MGVVFTRWRGPGQSDSPDAPDEAIVVTGEKIIDAGGGDTEVLIEWRYAGTVGEGR